MYYIVKVDESVLSVDRVIPGEGTRQLLLAFVQPCSL